MIICWQSFNVASLRSCAVSIHIPILCRFLSLCLLTSFFPRICSIALCLPISLCLPLNQAQFLSLHTSLLILTLSLPPSGTTAIKQEETYYTPEELIAMLMQHAKDMTFAQGGKVRVCDHIWEILLKSIVISSMPSHDILNVSVLLFFPALSYSRSLSDSLSLSLLPSTPTHFLQVIKDCVITVPSSFTQHERRALYTAAEIADLKVQTRHWTVDSVSFSSYFFWIFCLIRKFRHFAFSCSS